MKDKLGEKIMKELFGLRGKTCSYLTNGSGNQKARGTKIVSRKENLILKIIKTF